MFNDNLNGAGIFSGGGPCAEPSIDSSSKFCDELKPTDKGYPTTGYKDKPMYHYHGFEDSTVKFGDGKINSEWSITQKADVKTDFIEGFEHTFPVSNSDVTDVEKRMNP